MMAKFLSMPSISINKDFTESISIESIGKNSIGPSLKIILIYIMSFQLGDQISLF